MNKKKIVNFISNTFTALSIVIIIYFTCCVVEIGTHNTQPDYEYSKYNAVNNYLEYLIENLREGV